MRSGAKYFGRRDVILLSVVFGIIAGLYGLQLLFLMKDGSTAVVEVDGQEYGRYDLGTDREVPIVIDGSEENTLVIEQGAAFMSQASCPDQICVHQGRIFQEGQSIVCLPHRVVVTITGGESSKLDSISR
ncbi:MAG: NusG domain II-containing protein [Lachnospiraceae bacterium]|nr:NusG domain II-containing protein [Lachnospiraceae bacterium]